jgi:hypothetical protein
MKDTRLAGVKAIEDKGSGIYVIHFMFEPHIVITGTMGKVITLKMDKKSTASEIADYLIKVGHMIFDELKKG